MTNLEKLKQQMSEMDINEFAEECYDYICDDIPYNHCKKYSYSNGTIHCSECIKDWLESEVINNDKLSKIRNKNKNYILISSGKAIEINFSKLNYISEVKNNDKIWQNKTAKFRWITWLYRWHVFKVRIR